MLTTDQLLAERLEHYINNSRLSMNQIATKWGVSAPLLSLIKNQKKKAGVNLSLKILRESGSTLEQRKKWLDGRINEEGQEVSLVMNDLAKNRIEKKLQNNLCEAMENNPILMDIFLDISLMGEQGVSRNAIIRNYGEYGLSMVKFLLESGTVKHDNSSYTIVEKNVSHAFNEESSFNLMKSILELMKQKVKEEKFKGEFHFDISDISPTGFEKLNTLTKEYIKASTQILEEYEMPRLKGGVRIASQALCSVLKCVSIILPLAGLLMHTTTYASGGITGGASGNSRIGTVQSVSSSVQPLAVTSIPRPKSIKINSTIKIDFVNATFSTPTYESKIEAIKSIVLINEQLERGQLNKEELKNLLDNYPTGCDLSSSRSYLKNQLERALNEGNVTARGFEIKESYSPQGEPLYRAVGNFYVPCPKKFKN